MNSTDDVSAQLRKHLSPKIAARIRQYEADTLAYSTFQEELFKELNSLLERENLGTCAGFEKSINEQQLPLEQRAYLNRKALENTYEGYIAKGNRMEFFDGLYSAEAIGEQIPANFLGFLDLIVCSSVLPAEVIKLMKRNCLIISNQFPARPRFRLLLYKAIIRALHKRPESYVNTMMEVRQGLGNYLKEL